MGGIMRNICFVVNKAFSGAGVSLTTSGLEASGMAHNIDANPPNGGFERPPFHEDP
jgi:hypothetical protein